jgi:hypothetical protein
MSRLSLVNLILLGKEVLVEYPIRLSWTLDNQRTLHFILPFIDMGGLLSFSISIS